MGLIDDLRERLEVAAREHVAVRAALDPDARRPLVISKTRLARLACDGLQLDPTPYEHTTANVRGTLAHAAIEDDLARMDRSAVATTVVVHAWQRLASRSPGDPASLSAWMNRRDTSERQALVTEVAELVDAFREVWPRLDERAIVRTERSLAVMLGGGGVRMQGVPDLIVESPRRDDRARALVVDLKTGVPRPQQDRDELRFYALLHALATGRTPFRWATFYVTEGRHESEDLDAGLLEVTTRRVIDALAQASRLMPTIVERRTEGSRRAADATNGAGDDGALRIVAGGWCWGCRRADTCAVRAEALAHTPAREA